MTYIPLKNWYHKRENKNKNKTRTNQKIGMDQQTSTINIEIQNHLKYGKSHSKNSDFKLTFITKDKPHPSTSFEHTELKEGRLCWKDIFLQTLLLSGNLCYKQFLWLKYSEDMSTSSDYETGLHKLHNNLTETHLHHHINLFTALSNYAWL